MRPTYLYESMLVKGCVRIPFCGRIFVAIFSVYLQNFFSKGEADMKRRLALLLLAVLAMSTALFFAACDDGQGEETQGVTVAYSDLTSTGKETNTYAELFTIEHFKDADNNEYSRIDVFDKNKELDTSWFLLPEGVGNVTGAPDSPYMMTWQDRQNIMVSSASTMALINAMGALDRVPMTTSDTTWRIREIQDAIDGGAIKEVGKYSAPDYEQILTIGAEKHVTIAVFSAMIV